MADKPQQLNPVIAKLANKIAVLEIGKADAEAKLDMANQVIGQLQTEIARLKDLLPKEDAPVLPKTNGKSKAAHA